MLKTFKICSQKSGYTQFYSARCICSIIKAICISTKELKAGSIFCQARSYDHPSDSAMPRIAACYTFIWLFYVINYVIYYVLNYVIEKMSCSSFTLSIQLFNEIFQVRMLIRTLKSVNCITNAPANEESFFSKNPRPS